MGAGVVSLVGVVAWVYVALAFVLLVRAVAIAARHPLGEGHGADGVRLLDPSDPVDRALLEYVEQGERGGHAPTTAPLAGPARRISQGGPSGQGQRIVVISGVAVEYGALVPLRVSASDFSPN